MHIFLSLFAETQWQQGFALWKNIANLIRGQKWENVLICVSKCKF
jgi:hypothetical protein